MVDENIARAFNLLEEHTDLHAAYREGLLDLIEDYFNDHPKLQPSPLAHPAIIILGVVFYDIPLKNTHE